MRDREKARKEGARIAGMQEAAMAHREKASKEGARIASMAKKAQLLKENKLKNLNWKLFRKLINRI